MSSCGKDKENPSASKGASQEVSQFPQTHETVYLEIIFHYKRE